MAKTELGCQVLQEKGHFAEFAQFIRQHSHENEDKDLILKLKSILWAVVCLYAGSIPCFLRSYRAILELVKEVYTFAKKTLFLQF